MMANARSATELQVLLRSDDDDRAPLSSSELQLLRASAGDHVRRSSSSAWASTSTSLCRRLSGGGVVPQLRRPGYFIPAAFEFGARAGQPLFVRVRRAARRRRRALGARPRPPRAPRRCSGCSRAWRSRSSRCASSRAPSAGCAPTSSRAASRRPTAAARATRTSSERAANPSRRGTRRSRSPGSATSRSSSPRGCCTRGGSCGRRLWKLSVAATPWTIALLIGLSRIADYWHHWSDVAAGACIGNLAAYFAYRLRYPPPWVGDATPHAALLDAAAASAPARQAVAAV